MCMKNVHVYIVVVFLAPYSTYLRKGFLRLQGALDESIIRYFANKKGKTVPNIDLSMRVYMHTYMHVYIVNPHILLALYSSGFRVAALALI